MAVRLLVGTHVVIEAAELEAVGLGSTEHSFR
jgi:hypothetical protein